MKKLTRHFSEILAKNKQIDLILILKKLKKTINRIKRIKKIKKDMQLTNI
jgi:hypothetical protein